MDYKNFNGEDFAKDAFFIKWVKGDPESKWFWDTFLAEHPSLAGEIEKGRHLVEMILRLERKEMLEPDVHASMRNQLVMTLKANREREKEHPAGRELLKPGSKKVFFGIGIAASLALLVSLVWVLNRSNPAPAPAHRVQTYGLNELKPVFTDSLEMRVNPRGQKSVMLLADGTKVWLNADSKLTYARDFGGQGLREVYLEGEAFFDVTRDPERPFLVHTSDLHIKVLGTSFNVKSYADDGRIETTLVEGKVEINKPDEAPGEKKVILQPNQKATFLKESKDIEVREVAAEEVVAWRHDRLVFKSEPFHDVIKQLERWYNVRIHLEENAYSICPLTASIEKESLEEILDFLTLTHKISFSISGSEVYIKGSVCK